ncbi:MAG: ABC transporter permease [Bryobacteraceae bacterium]
MRFVRVCALKDLRRFRRDPIALAIWLGVPLLVCTLLVVIFGRGGVTPKGTLLVADEDGSLVSSLLPGAFSQGPLGEMITVEKVSQAEGRARISRGDGSALLVVPKGFGDAVLEGKASRLTLVTNPSQRILPQIIEESVSVLAEAAFYLEALAGDRIRHLATGSAPTDQTVAEASVAFNQIGRKVSAYLNRRRIDLETQTTGGEDGGSFNLALAFIPSMLFLAVLFLAMGFSGEVWKERRQGVLRRLLATPGRPEAFLLGRTLSLALVLLVAAAGGLIVARTVVATSISAAAAAVAMTVLAGVAMYLLFQVLVMYAPNERAASVMANLLLFPLAMLGGSFFPFEVMPSWLASIGRFTPNGRAVSEVGAILAGKADPVSVAWVSLGLAALAAVAFVLIVRRLRRGFAL